VTGLRRRTAALLAAAVAVACALPIGGAQADPATDNTATAIVEQDDARVADLAWDVSRRKGDEAVTHHNGAIARARCLRCRATAIAFQIVLVSGSPEQVAPINTAEAVNVECTDCVAIAQARQFVRVVPSRMRLTGAGRARLSGVRERLEGLLTQDLTPEQVHQAVEAEEDEVLAVLAEELVVSDEPDREAWERRMLQATDLA
jgi:putative peptide zinc metalloprotease protein